MVHDMRVVQFGEVAYPFYVRHGIEALSEFAQVMAGLNADRFLVVADTRATQSLRHRLAQTLELVAPTIELLVEPSEQHKNLATVGRLAEAALAEGVSRRTCVIAVGGGVVGNIAGLLAALLFRGIRLVHVPTTFLAMSDSVLSTKQGVNSRQGKNHLGAFHPPTFVWNQLDFLDSLPADEMRAAMCEAIKNVLAIKHEFVDDLEKYLNSSARYSHDELALLLDFCVSAKMSVMRSDVYEKHAGLVLEYGHTVGHALENLSGGGLRHGYAVGLGMLAAARISVELGFLTREEEDLHYHLLRKNGAPTVYDGSASASEVLGVLRKDNKRGYLSPVPGKYDFVLLERIGSPRKTNETVITQVDEAEVASALGAITSAQFTTMVA
ncbi:MAG TPA: iron-containing alcohol dehydrogenase [Allosphingosinicella sp.]|jgi:3-dehydroquinate synthase/2-deoxy-scyllo-inosose synthase